MERKREVEIIIQYLKQEVTRISKEYPSLLYTIIIENGKLLEKYGNELDEIERLEK